MASAAPADSKLPQTVGHKHELYPQIIVISLAGLGLPRRAQASLLASFFARVLPALPLECQCAKNMQRVAPLLTACPPRDATSGTLAGGTTGTRWSWGAYPFTWALTNLSCLHSVHGFSALQSLHGSAVKSYSLSSRSPLFLMFARWSAPFSLWFRNRFVSPPHTPFSVVHAFLAIHLILAVF